VVKGLWLPRRGCVSRSERLELYAGLKVEKRLLVSALLPLKLRS
jgi:hypothetical protein